MERIEIEDGFVKLSSANGIVDKRNGAVYSVVICSATQEEFFEEVSDSKVEEAPKKKTRKSSKA